MKRINQGPISPKWTEIERVDQIGSNGTKVNLIELNINCLIFREKKLSSTNFRKKKNYTLYYNYKIIIYSHVLCGSASN